MRVKHISLVAIAVLLAISITASPAMACLPPGESPGYWRNEVRRYVVQRGALHEYIIGLTAAIDTELKNPPYPWGLPPMPNIDGDGAFDIDDAYVIFWDGPSSMYKTLWVDLANWYNYVRGWGPV